MSISVNGEVLNSTNLQIAKSFHCDVCKWLDTNWEETIGRIITKVVVWIDILILNNPLELSINFIGVFIKEKEWLV